LVQPKDANEVVKTGHYEAVRMAAWKVALSVWRLAVQSDGEMVAWKVESRDVSMVA
jgi:hypothetical protein